MTRSGDVPSTRLPFVAAVARALDGPCGIERRSRLVLAVSGGADSMALLLALAALARRSHRRYALTVAHVNHHLREEAGTEAAAVRDAAAPLGLDYVELDIHPGRRAGNLAAVARDLRYKALARVAHDRNAVGVVTAHHGTDQLETVMMALLRGAGLDGLAALAWRARRWDTEIVRPLLSLTHQQCCDLCSRCGWSWSEDPSNLDESKRRNLMRARLLPLLLELAPDVDGRIHRTTDLLRQAAELVEREAARAFVSDEDGQFDRARLAAAGELVVGAGLRRAAVECGSPRDELAQEVVRPVVEAIMQTGTRRPRRFHWPGGVIVEVRSKVVRIAARGNR